MDLHEAARSYAAAGFSVFPCKTRSKEPDTPHGYKDATTDQEAIDRWWSSNPEANVAIATIGDLVVIDTDDRHGGDETWAKLAQDLRDVPAGPFAITPGGLHNYFRDPTERAVPSKDRLGKGCDVKARSGYVIAPPSVHPSGAEYLWGRGHSLLDCDLPTLPDYFVERIAERREPIRPVLRRTVAHPNEYLERQCREIEQAAEGQRHDTIMRNSVRCALRIGRDVSPDVLFAALTGAGLHAVGEQRRNEVLRTVHDGLEFGLTHRQ